MANYVTSVASPWSAQRAFAYLANLENFAQWDPGVKSSVAVTGSGPGLGAAWDVTVGGIGRDITLRYVITALEADRCVKVRARTSTLDSFDVMTVTPTETGCVVVYDATLVTTGALKVVSPLLALVFRRIGDRAAEGLRSVLDATNGAATSSL